MTNYFYFDNLGQKQGPVNDQQLQALAARGTITPQTQLETDSGHKGMAGQIPGLFPATPSLFAQSPVQAAPPVGTRFCSQCGNQVHPQAVTCTRCGSSVSSHQTRHHSGSSNGIARSTFVLLAIFCGGLGVHNFFAKRIPAGILNIVCFIAMLVAVGMGWSNLQICNQLNRLSMTYGTHVVRDSWSADDYGNAAAYWLFFAGAALLVQIILIVRDISCQKTDGNGVPMNE